METRAKDASEVVGFCVLDRLRQIQIENREKHSKMLLFLVLFEFYLFLKIILASNL